MKECSIGDGVGNEGAGMEVPPNSLESWETKSTENFLVPHSSPKKRGIINIDPGRRNPWWRGGRRSCLFHFHFHFRSRKVKVESESFIAIIVCLVGILLSVLETGLCRKYSQNKCSKFQKPLEAVETWN